MLTRKNVRRTDGDKFVTKKHFDDTMGAIKQTFDQMEARMATKQEMASVKKMQERTLQIVESIDQHFKEWKTLPQRMEKVEAEVFKLKMEAK